MPAKSAAQKRLMDAAAHNPAFAKKAGIKQSVAKEYSEASKGLKFKKGRSRTDLQKANKPKTRQGMSELFKTGGSAKTKRTVK